MRRARIARRAGAGFCGARFGPRVLRAETAAARRSRWCSRCGETSMGPEARRRQAAVALACRRDRCALIAGCAPSPLPTDRAATKSLSRSWCWARRAARCARHHRRPPRAPRSSSTARRADGRARAPGADRAAPDAQCAGASPSRPRSRCSSARKAIPASARRAVVAGRALPLPKASPQRIVVVGDTGCRLKSADQGLPSLQRFGGMAVRGDCRRGGGRRRPISSSTSATITTARTRARTATPDAPAARGATAGTPGRRTSSRRRERLLAAAPWIVVRGNHEICAARGRAGGASSIRARCPRDRTAMTRSTTRAATTASRTRCRWGRRPPPIRSSSSSIRRWSASRRCRQRSDAPQVPGAVRARVRAGRATAEQLLHHPSPGARVRGRTRPTPTRRTRATRAAVGAGSTAPGPCCFRLPCRRCSPVTCTCSRWSAFRRRSRRSSSSATAATGSTRRCPRRCRRALTPSPGAVIASLVATNRYGFMTIERDGARWRMVAHDAHGAPLISCTLLERRAKCDTAASR